MCVWVSLSLSLSLSFSCFLPLFPSFSLSLFVSLWSRPYRPEPCVYPQPPVCAGGRWPRPVKELATSVAPTSRTDGLTATSHAGKSVSAALWSQVHPLAGCCASHLPCWWCRQCYTVRCTTHALFGYKRRLCSTPRKPCWLICLMDSPARYFGSGETCLFRCSPVPVASTAGESANETEAGANSASSTTPADAAVAVHVYRWQEGNASALFITGDDERIGTPGRYTEPHHLLQRFCYPNSFVLAFSCIFSFTHVCV